MVAAHEDAGLVLDDPSYTPIPEEMCALLEQLPTEVLTRLLAVALDQQASTSQGLETDVSLRLDHLYSHSVLALVDSLQERFADKKKLRQKLEIYEQHLIMSECSLNATTGDLIVVLEFFDRFRGFCKIDVGGCLHFRKEKGGAIDEEEWVVVAYFLEAIMKGRPLKLSGHKEGLREVLCRRLFRPSRVALPTVELQRILVFSGHVNRVLSTKGGMAHREHLGRFPIRRTRYDIINQDPVLKYDNETDVYIDSIPRFSTGRTPAQDKVLFQFSDGKNLFFSELIHHPYAALVDRSIWPRDPDDAESVKLRLVAPGPPIRTRRVHASDYWRDEEEDETCRYLNRVLEKNLERANPVPVFLVPSSENEAEAFKLAFDDDMPPRKMFFGLQVKAIRYSESCSHIWLDPPFVALIRNGNQAQEPGPKRLVLSSGFLEYEVRTRTLHQLGLKADLERFGKLRHAFNRSPKKIPSALEVLKTPCNEGSVLDPERINYMLEEVFRPDGRYGSQASMSDRVEKGSYDGLRIDLISDSADSTAQSVIIKTQSHFPGLDRHIQHCGVESMEVPFRAALFRGIGSVFEVPNPDLATTIDPVMRKHELVLYRHQGLVAALFMLIRDLERKQAISTTMGADAFIAVLEAHLRPILYLIITGEKATGVDQGVNLEAFVSDQFISNLKQFLKWLFGSLFEQERRRWVFASDTEWGYVDLREAARAKLTFLAHCILEEGTPGQAPKSRIKNVRIPATHDAFFAAPHALDQALTFFKGSKHTFFLNGKSIEMISASDLSVGMQLEEQGEGTDWFELHPEVFFNGKKLDIDQAMDLKSGIPILYRGAYYLIDRDATTPLDWLAYFWRQLQPGHSRSHRKSGKIVEVPRCQFLELFALKTLGIEIAGPPRWQAMAANYEKLSRRQEGFEAQDILLLSRLGLPLHAFQQTGVLWMRTLFDLGLGGILGDDMGLGKTIQSIGLLKSLDVEGRLGTCLVVVPTSLVFNWSLEFEKFAPDLTVQVFDPKSRSTLKSDDDRIILCTYGLLTRHIQAFARVQWNVVILDEAQALKNIMAKRTGWVRKLKANAKFCLTGTPMENHFGEFFSLIDLCVPGALGEYSSFMKRYSIQSTHRPSPEDVTFLRKKTSPLVLRRHKKEILDQLPPKIETHVRMDLEKEQARIYRDIATSWNQRVKEAIDQKGEAQSQLEMLTALLRLRQVCSCPAIIPEVDYSKTPPKFELLVSELKIILAEGSSAVVFTNFKRTLEQFKELLQNQGFPVSCISGEVPRARRGEILRQFEASCDPMILLMTLKTGGVGLNLTKASYVFHMDPWWNPQVEYQATDRVHRMGQEKSVNVYRLIMRDTIEEKIQALKKVKKQAFDSLFLDPGTLERVSDLTGEPTSGVYAHTGLTAEDFKYLLT